MKILKQLVMAQEEIENDNPEKVAEMLFPIISSMEAMIKAVRRMGERLKPEFFFNSLRKYLTGFQRFENGLKFEGVPEYEKEGVRFTGAAGGQSPFYQTFENALELVYDDVGIESMRKELFEGMTQVNKEMVTDAKEYFSIRSYVLKHQGKVREAYNEIIDTYMKYKQTHWSLIARFIVNPAKNMRMEKDKLTGTGGTPLFALQKMDEMLAMNKI